MIPKFKNFGSFGTGSWKNWWKDLQDGWNLKPFKKVEGPVSINLFSFKDKDSLDKWTLHTDQSFGGKSEGSLTLGEQGQAIFKGTLSQFVPEGASKSGFVAIKSKPIDFSEILDDSIDSIELKIKSEGGMYICNLNTNTLVSGEVFQTIFSPPPGKWSNIILPLEDFFVTWRGRINDNQVNVIPQRIIGVGILMAQRKDGPFHLEIEYINAINHKFEKKSQRYNI